MFKSELLSPARMLKNMRCALTYGADAVYAGQPHYSLRVRSNEFSHKNLQLGISEAHALGKKPYVMVNITPHDAKLKMFIRDLKSVVEVGSDALIMSDLGLIMLVREHLPEMLVHLSVQANAVNWAMVKSWQQMGLTRVILPRELSPDKVEETRRQVPETEIEVFVYGTLYMAYSGRCLLSGYINKRDPNQGTRINVRHWEYNVAEDRKDDVGNIVHKYGPISVQTVELTFGVGAPIDKIFVIGEAKRPDGYMTIFEDEYGTYIVDSEDLRAITHVERLTQMGVHSLKIEGRTKSFYHYACTVQVYRRVTDDAAAGKPFDTSLLETLEGLTHRGYTESFLCRHACDGYQNYEYGYFLSERQQFVGKLTGEYSGPLVAVAVKNEFGVGDSLELMTLQDNVNFTLEHMENGRGEVMLVAPGDGYTVWLSVSDDLSLQYALPMHNLTGQTTRNPYGN